MPYRKIQNLELSSFAQLDIEDIVQYTFVNYGLIQVDKYLDTLMQAMVLIAESSDIGHKREDLPNNYKAWSVEKHIIVYKLKGQIIYISRILHESMDFENQTIDQIK